VRFARQMGAEMVVAVDISAATKGADTGDALRMLMQTFAIMGHSISQHELRDADVVLRPVLGGVAGTDFAGRQKAITAGRNAAMAALPELKLQMAKLSR
jgi:NTE family protein